MLLQNQPHFYLISRLDQVTKQSHEDRRLKRTQAYGRAKIRTRKYHRTQPLRFTMDIGQGYIGPSRRSVEEEEKEEEEEEERVQWMTCKSTIAMD
nr:unnamed protein product [Spirometra erinaceieuropaei]